MLSAATMVHAATGGDGTGHGAWTAIIPDAFQFDRHGAAPPPAHALPDAALSPAGSSGQAAHATGSAGRGTYGSSLRDGTYETGRMGGGGYDGLAGSTPRGLAIFPDAHADPGSLAAAPLLRHDRWALGEGLAAGDAYAYLVCGVPADPPACFEATLAVVRRDAASPIEGSVYSPAASPIPWHMRVTIRDLIGYYTRDGPTFRLSDYQATGAYDDDMRTLRKAALFDSSPPAPWSFDLRFAGVRYEPRPVPPDPTAMRYAGALEDTVFLLGSKIAVEMGPYNDRHPVLEDGEQWPNSVGAAVHVRESIPEYEHDYLYGPVHIRGGEPGSGRAMHRVSYTGDAVPMADMVIADGIPFPLSGGVRDAVLPMHFASDPHVDGKWWFRLVAVSSESTRASGSAGDTSGGGGISGMSAPGADRTGNTGGRAGTGGGSGIVPVQPPSPSPAIAAPASGTGAPSSPAAGTVTPPINVQRIGALLDDPAGLYDYLTGLARELTAAGGVAGVVPNTSTPQHPTGPALTVSTDRTSYARGQPVAISGTARAAWDGTGATPNASPFVMISITGPGGSSVASRLALLDTSGTGYGTSTYAATINTTEWSPTKVPAGNLTVIAVHGTDTATAMFELLHGGNMSTAHRPPAILADEHYTPAPDRPSQPPTPAATPLAPHTQLTVAAADVAYQHGENATLSGTATRPILDPFVDLSVAGPDGTSLAGLKAPVGPNGRYTLDVQTRDWHIGPAGYGTVTITAVRGPDIASATFELLPPPPAAPRGTPPPIPASALPDIQDVEIAGIGNGTLPGTGASGQDIGSAGIRSHIRYMIDGNRTVGDMIVYDHSVVVYLGASPPEPHPAVQPTLWLRIPRTVMDPPDLDGDGRTFDVRIDGAASTGHTEASDATHHTLSIPVRHTTGVVDVSGAVAAAATAGPDDHSSGGRGESGTASAPPIPQPPDPASAPQPLSCTGTARCLRSTITSVAAADTIFLSGGMSVRLALVSVPAPLEAGGERARLLVSSICPAGTQLAIDEDDTGASATSTTFRSRIVAEAFCSGGTVSIQDVLVASGLGTIDRTQCGTSEFASRAWAASACGVVQERSP